MISIVVADLLSPGVLSKYAWMWWRGACVDMMMARGGGRHNIHNISDGDKWSHQTPAPRTLISRVPQLWRQFRDEYTLSIFDKQVFKQVDSILQLGCLFINFSWRQHIYGHLLFIHKSAPNNVWMWCRLMSKLRHSPDLSWRTVIVSCHSQREIYTYGQL